VSCGTLSSLLTWVLSDKKPKKETAEGGDGAAATTAAGSSEDEDEGEDEDGVGTAGAGGPAEGPGATVGDGVQWHVDASKEAVAERRRIAEEARLDAALTSPSSRSALARTPSGGTADGFGPSDDRDDGATTGAVAEIAMALASSAKDVTLLVEAVSSAQTKRGMRASERAALYCRAAFDGGLVVQSKDSTHLAVLSALLVSKDPASASAGQHGLLSALQVRLLLRYTVLYLFHQQHRPLHSVANVFRTSSFHGQPNSCAPPPLCFSRCTKRMSSTKTPSSLGLHRVQEPMRRSWRAPSRFSTGLQLQLKRRRRRRTR
jgi:hypothetical protein